MGAKCMGFWVTLPHLLLAFLWPNEGRLFQWGVAWYNLAAIFAELEQTCRETFFLLRSSFRVSSVQGTFAFSPPWLWRLNYGHTQEALVNAAFSVSRNKQLCHTRSAAEVAAGTLGLWVWTLFSVSWYFALTRIHHTAVYQCPDCISQIGAWLEYVWNAVRYGQA